MGEDSTKKVELIVECGICKEKEKLISQMGKIKYRLPMIDSYVVEIPESRITHLRNMEGVNSVNINSKITAQMNFTRRILDADYTAYRDKYTGRGVTIAVLDTGVAPVDDLCLPRNRIIGFKDFINNRSEPYDDNAHGTHVSGIAAGNGYSSNGKYVGIAPKAKIVGIKILNEKGNGKASDVLAGLQWLMDNKDIYNIRIANLSIGTIDVGSKDPLVKAVEYAWDNGIVMTIAAGNNGPEKGTITSPGISRKAITVGASDDDNAVTIWSKNLVNYSGRGPTSECIIKPDVIAPGSDIISCLSNTSIDESRREELDIVSENYVRMSGTSMATPAMAGAVALLLEKYPKLTPDDVKYMIKKATSSMNYPQNQQGWGIISIEKLLSQEAVHVKKQ